MAFDGSYVWGANSLALKMSGITRDTPNPPGGEIVKGPDGEPNGILRNASQLLKGAARAETYQRRGQGGRARARCCRSMPRPDSRRWATAR